MQIAPLLNIGRGVTALIGGGGKTTLLYTLTEELRKKGTVLLCTSTHIMRPTQYEVLERAGEAEISAALSAHGAVCVGEPSAEGKLGPPSLSFDALTLRRLRGDGRHARAGSSAHSRRGSRRPRLHQ